MEHDVEIKTIKKEEEKIAKSVKNKEHKTSKEELADTPTEKTQEDAKEKADDKKITEQKETKKEKPKTKIVKKDSAVVKGVSLPISTKQAVAICKFIKGKTIREAVDYLEQVAKGKRAIPMKGEIPHRRNQDFTIMSGRFPKNASENFIKILRSLGGNAVANGLDNPVIVEAIANMADRPHGKFGRTRKKRSHVTIKVKDKIIKLKEKKK